MTDMIDMTDIAGPTPQDPTDFLKEATEEDKFLLHITATLLDGLTVADIDHKQWALERALLALCGKEGLDLLKEKWQWEEGGCCR